MYRQAPGRLLTVCRALEVAPLKPLGAIQLRAPPHLRERRKLQEKAAQDLAMNGTAAGKARVWTGQLQHQTRAGSPRLGHYTHCCWQQHWVWQLSMCDLLPHQIL